MTYYSLRGLDSIKQIDRLLLSFNSANLYKMD